MRSLAISAQTILFYLIPFSLLTGPFLPDLFITLIGIIFLFISIKEKKYIYYKNKFFYLFLIFYFYLILSSVFSDDPLHSLKNSFFYFRFCFFSLATWFLIDENKNFTRNFFIIFFLTFLIALFDGYYQFFNKISIFGFYTSATRLTLLLNDRLLLGSFLVRLFPILIALLLTLKVETKYKILISLILFVITDVLIYLTGERTAFGLLIIFSIFVILVTPNYKRLRLLTFLISIIIIFLITINKPDILERNIKFTLEQTNLSSLFVNDKSNIYIFSPQHHSHIISAIRMFMDKPIFGHGVNTFRLKCNKAEFKYNDESCSTHPHNTYVQILSELGLLGLIPIIIIIYHFFMRILNHFLYSKNNPYNKLSDYEVFIIAAIVISLWPLLPSQNFFNNWINVIYYLPVGFYLQSLYRKNYN